MLATQVSTTIVFLPVFPLDIFFHFLIESLELLMCSGLLVMCCEYLLPPWVFSSWFSKFGTCLWNIPPPTLLENGIKILSYILSFTFLRFSTQSSILGPFGIEFFRNKYLCFWFFRWCSIVLAQILEILRLLHFFTMPVEAYIGIH